MFVATVVAVLSNGEEIVFEDGPGPDGVLRRRRFEEEPDGHISVYSDHVRIGQDGEEAVVESVRLARFSPEKLVSISHVDERGSVSPHSVNPVDAAVPALFVASVPQTRRLLRR